MQYSQHSFSIGSRFEEASSDESTSSSEEGEGEGEECVRVLEWKPQRALGDWEKHTTGIGSRLLAKMGYEIGKGLGKEGQGRVEPVKIVILPAGKSLDVCAELREAKKLGRSVGGEGAKRRRKRTKKEQKLSESLSVEKEEHQDMFEFLNSKILNRPADPTTLKGSAQNPKIGRKENPNVMLLKVQEDMKSTRKRCLSLQEALKRNKGDKTMETKLREKLEAAKTNLEELQHQEHSIDKSITSKKERKKLCIF